MSTALLKTLEPGLPSKEDLAQFQATSRALAKLNGRECVRVEATSPDEERQTFVLPAAAVRFLTDIMAHLAEGRAVSVMPKDAELTTKQAADALNVSRPHLVRLLKDGKVPHHMAGTHRRVLLQDVLAYRRARLAASNDAMDELAAQAQELGLGY